MLYVARTRARDFLLVTGSTPVSEFLDDMAGKRIAWKQQGNTAGGV